MRNRFLMVGLLAIGVAACGDDVQVIESGPPPPPPLTAVMAPSSQTVPVGGAVAFVVSVSGGAAGEASWTCASSDPSKATVSNTPVGCAVTAVAAGGVTITATVTKGGETFNVGAGLTVLEDMADDAALSLSSITDGDMDDEYLSGRVSVTLNVERGDQVLMQLSLLVDGVVVDIERLGGASAVAAPEDGPAAQAVVAHILSFRSDAYNAVTGEPKYLNVEHTISGELMVAGRDEPIESFGRTVEFNNPANVHVALSGLGSGAMNASTGQLWYGGPGADLTITAVPVKYTPGAVESVTLLAGICGSAIMTDSDAPYEFKPGCKEEDTVMAANFRLSSGGQSIDVVVNEGSVFPVRLDYTGPDAPHFKVNPNKREDGWINAAVDFVGESGSGSKKDGWLVYNDEDASAGVGGYTPQLRFNFADSDKEVGVALAVPPSQNPVLPPDLIGSSSKKDALCVVVSAVDLLGNESKLPKADADCVKAADYSETDEDGATTYAAGLLAGVDTKVPTIRFTATSPKADATTVRNFQVHVADEDSGIRDLEPVSAEAEVRDAKGTDEIDPLGLDISLPLATTTGFQTGGMGYHTFAAKTVDKAGNSSEEIVRTALRDTEIPVTNTIVGDYNDKTATYSLIATVTDNLSIKEYWAEMRFTGLQIGDLTIPNNLFLPREGGVAVDAFNAPTLTQATLASSFTAQTYRAIQTSATNITNLSSIGVFARDNADGVSAGALLAGPGVTVAPGLEIAAGFDLTADAIDEGTEDDPGAASADDSKIFTSLTADSTSVAGGVVTLEAWATGPLGFLAPISPVADDPTTDADEAVVGVAGMQGLRDNPISRVDFYAAVATDGGNGREALKFIGSVSGASAGAIDYDGNRDGNAATTDNDSRSFIYSLEMSEAEFLAIVGGEDDYGTEEDEGAIVAFAVKDNKGVALASDAFGLIVEE